MRMQLVLIIMLSWSILDQKVSAKSSKSENIPTADVTTGSKWIEACLKWHNDYRSLHQVAPLQLNNTLSEISQHWANHLLEEGLKSYEETKSVKFFDHNPKKGRENGENLYYTITSVPHLDFAHDSIRRWYEEIADYDFTTARRKVTSKPEAKIGHFTQLVWDSTRQMGTAYASKTLPNNYTMIFVVANYFPGGNVVYSNVENPMQSYFKNVPPPLSYMVESNIDLEALEDEIYKKIIILQLKQEPVNDGKKEWMEDALKCHNEYRHEYDAPSLVLNTKMSELSQYWASKLLNEMSIWYDRDRSLRSFKENKEVELKGGFGENLIYFVSNVEPSAKDVIQLWYNGSNYEKLGSVPRDEQTSSSFSSRKQNFHQIVWKSTRALGISYSSKTLKDGQLLTVIVATYYPPANSKYKSDNEIRRNVHSRSSKDSRRHTFSPILLFQLATLFLFIK